jgi:drug/metabolite transporter (DMT)-like permease
MRYYALLIVTSMLWASNFVAGKFVVGHAHPLVLTDLRWGMAVICLIPFVWWKERKLLPPKRALVPLFCMGLTGVVLFNWFMFLALERTTADNTGLISALNPISIAICSFFFLREKLTVRQIGSMLISLFGVLIVISHGDWHKVAQFHFNSGDLFMLAAVGMWGLYSAAGKLAMKHVSPFLSTLWQGIFGLLVLLPFSLPKFHIEDADLAFWSASVYIGIAATVLAMVFWNIGVQKVGGTRSGVFLNFNPIFTAITAYLLLGEEMNTYQWIGTAVVIGGVLLFTFKGRLQV